MKNTVSYLTKEKFEELKLELEELKTKKRKEVAENLEYSKSLGDLSENAEYHEAREAQMNLEGRINKIEDLLKSATIMSLHHTDKVSIGSTVTIKKKTDDTKMTYNIVGSEEADMVSGKISITAPLADAMIDKKKGDIFTVSTPKGKTEYEIVEIR
jgi:transcription elongation factor GreA